MRSRNILSTDPDNNTKSKDSSIPFGGPEQNLTLTENKNLIAIGKRLTTRSGQLRRLESEQTELFKTFDGHIDVVESHLAQYKTMSAERANRCFFESYDELEENRQQRQLLKSNCLKSFDAHTERKLSEIQKTIKWLVEQMSKLDKIDPCRNKINNHQNDTLQLQLSG